MDFDDPLELIRALPDLRKRRFQTPGGRAGRPFSVLKHDQDQIVLRSSRGGRITLRALVFQTAEQILRDLGQDSEGGWVLLSNDILDAVLRGENRDHACTSYVFPLLEAVDRVEIDRGRPARLRLRRDEDQAS